MKSSRLAALRALVLAAGSLAAAGAAALAADQPALPAAPSGGEGLFRAHCASCHEPATGQAAGRAPGRAALSGLPTLQIFNVLKNGAMRPMTVGLADKDLYAISVWLSAPDKAAAPTPPADPPRCAAAAPFSPAAGDWNGWGNGLANTRLQSAPGLAKGDVRRLKVKWALGYYGGKYGQPTVVGGRMFLTSTGGVSYALDAKTGCMIWRSAGAYARSTITVGMLPGAAPSGYAAFFGDAQGQVHALDAADGKPLWTAKVDSHAFAIVTGGPVLWGHRLYVPLSSYEEVGATQPRYACCSFRGSIVALDAATGEVAWKTYAIDKAPTPSGHNTAGTQTFGPAGGAVWSSPTIDVKRGALYFDTGDSYTSVKQDGADAVVALDLATGKVKWKTQVTDDDNYVSGCESAPGPNCPKPLGRDFDFGGAPILHPLSAAKDIILAGQKSGAVFGLDPDSGRILWRRQVGEGGPLGGVEWGMADDGARLYVGVADAFMPAPPGRPGLYALDPASGRALWSAPSPSLPCNWPRPAVCLSGVSAPPTAMPGVVFAGDMNGRLRAYRPGDGKLLWQDDTGAGRYATVNGLAAAPGGNVDGPGPVVAGGMLYVFSGYLSALGGGPLNVLLAYSVDGK